ncbi:DUF1801 domain-containing protein [Herbiconiux daphne]|uniref:DUF1801 domain-containing protein n=1 Tax=Herbiconiux daphne TaxID=2970914 RepID=A0ABT2H0M3_9MICO|nr:DUF1801 domain-containing protein [Herbiconiux daphne]MCS5733487.1 DUF1801 domain-containing protein [Herbiconiux daphne]
MNAAAGAKAGAGGKDSASFSAEERAAMKARAAELKAEARRASAAEKAAADAAAVEAKIAEMQQPDKAMAERLHTIVTDAAPELAPKLYYGQPGWAKGGKIVVFFRSGIDDKLRYSTLGFGVDAQLDDESGLWPSSYALDHLTDETAAEIAALVRRAAADPAQ